MRKEPVMTKVRFIGLDVHADTIAVAVAEPSGEVRSLGMIPNRPESIRKLVKKLGAAESLRVCYEAGPTGYVTYWQLTALGVRCEVVAPTLVPTKAGDRVKLEDASIINRFKSDSEYARRVEISTLHKVLAILRAAIRWGQAQTPPLIDKSPFHRFGVRLNTKAETVRDRRISREEEKRLLDAALVMNTWEHKYVGPLMHDRIIGALELCSRVGEMLLIQNKRIDRESHTIGIPGQTTKDKENRRIPFDPNGRLAAVLSRRGKLGPNAFVFGSENGEYVGSFKTAWESLLLIANGHETKRAKPSARVDRVKLRQIDLHWHDLRHEGARRLLADGVDIRIIQLMLGHASVQQTQRYLNVTDDELRKGLEVSWKRRTLKAVAGGQNA
jgi:integrase